MMSASVSAKARVGMTAMMRTTRRIMTVMTTRAVMMLLLTVAMLLLLAQVKGSAIRP
jgi:hypothetical protein